LLTPAQDAARRDWETIRGRFAKTGLEPELAGFLAAAELVMAPLFQAPPWTDSGKSWAKSALSGLSARWRVRLRYASERLATFCRDLALDPRRRRQAWAMLTNAQLRRNFIDTITTQWRNMR